MKDLKHLIFFENLLQDAQNELVTQAVNDGKIALGYNCYYIPEVLLNLPGCFSSRLRAPRCESTDVATYYMTSRVCPYVRSILERAIEGGYNYLNALFGAECCASMERMEEHFFLINPVKNDRFFVTQIDPPLKGDKTSYDYYKGQLQLKVVDQLAERYGVDTSDAAMRATIEKFNELCDVITEIGNFRKLPNPPITGYEFHVIQLVSEVCPHDLILPYLKETLAEIKKRKPEPEFPFRARVVVAGSEIDDPEFTKLLEGCGAMVVADRYCFGSFPSRERIEIRDGETGSIAIRSAITGHLVLSTLHTNDAASSIVRLIDMGVASYMVASSVNCVVAQRLVKKLCPECKRKREIKAEESALLKDPSITHIYEPVGCPRCGNTGYKGRTAIYEIIEIDSDLRRMISEGRTTEEIRDFAKEHGATFLEDSIRTLIGNGTTSMSEFYRLIYSI